MTINEYRELLSNLIKLNDEIAKKCKETGKSYNEILNDMRGELNEI